MNSFYCRWWLAGAALISAASVQAETIPITLSMKATSDFRPITNIQFTPLPPNTVTLATLKAPFHAESPRFIELTLPGIEPDSNDRMLNYKLGDPPSYAWTITAGNAADFGVNWIEFQNHLNESKPNDSGTGIRFFHPSPESQFNPIATDFAFVTDVVLQYQGWATDFQLHEIKISIDYYFWHDILEGLRGVQIKADVRGDALIRVVPEPAAGALVSLGLILAGFTARKRGQ